MKKNIDFHLEQEDQPLTHERLDQKHQNMQYQGLAVFCIVVALVVIMKLFSQYDQDVQNGKFYKNQLMSLDLIKEWQMSEQKMKEQQNEKQSKIINKTVVMTRQQLGHQTWTLLHMITGSFPQNIDQNLKKKFNTFLIVFGQMFPCKLCANHFMQLLKIQGLFKGNNKKQLMEYLCKIHNIVNLKLGHDQHNCQQVYQQWSTCGCPSSKT